MTDKSKNTTNYHILGKTGFKVSEISLGTWQLGSRWGGYVSNKIHN